MSLLWTMQSCTPLSDLTGSLPYTLWYLPPTGMYVTPSELQGEGSEGHLGTTLLKDIQVLTVWGREHKAAAVTVQKWTSDCHDGFSTALVHPTQSDPDLLLTSFTSSPTCLQSHRRALFAKRLSKLSQPLSPHLILTF